MIRCPHCNHSIPTTNPPGTRTGQALGILIVAVGAALVLWAITVGVLWLTRTALA